MRINGGMFSGPGANHVGLFGRPTIMLAKEGDNGGSGGGGDDDDDDDGEDKKFTERFNKLFHKAMSEREKRLEGKIMKGLETTLGSKFDEFKSMLESTKVPKPDDEETTKEKARTKDGKFMPPEVAAEIAKAQKDAKEALALAERFKTEANAEKMRASKTEERQSLITSLGGKVKPQLLDMVVDQLHGKHITRDPESQKILWKNEDGEVLPLKDGLDSWVKSDFAKEVAPPREARGSGGRGGSADGGTTKGPMTADQLGAIISGGLTR